MLGSSNLSKLKTNLRLAVNRLKLLEKKKTELAQKARKEIADYIAGGKYERAKIRVEHIIREDYLVEAMEVVEMYCDLLLARFGLIQQMKTLDEGLSEAISSLIWVAPRLQADVAELKIIAEQLTQKYGKQYAMACRDNAVQTVNEKLMHKMGVQAPPKILVEQYLFEIAKSHNVPYEPDPEVMRQDEVMAAEAMLIDFQGGDGKPGAGSGHGGRGGGSGGGGSTEIGFIVGPQPVPHPQPYQPFSYPSQTPNSSLSSSVASPPPLPQVPPSAPYPSLSQSKEEEANTPYFGAQLPVFDDTPVPSYDQAVNLPKIVQPPNVYNNPKPTPAPRSQVNLTDTLPELPAVPTGNLSTDFAAGESTGDDVDFDDLAKRFDALKKKK